MQTNLVEARLELVALRQTMEAVIQELEARLELVALRRAMEAVTQELEALVQELEALVQELEALVQELEALVQELEALAQEQEIQHLAGPRVVEVQTRVQTVDLQQTPAIKALMARMGQAQAIRATEGVVSLALVATLAVTLAISTLTISRVVAAAPETEAREMATALVQVVTPILLQMTKKQTKRRAEAILRRGGLMAPKSTQTVR